MLARISFKSKILLLVSTAAVGIALLAFVSALNARNDALAGQRDELRTAVESAYNIIAGYEALAVSGKMSTADAQSAAIQAVRNARFGGRDGKTEYFYIYTMDGLGVMHPFHPEFAGKNVADTLKDGNGRLVIRDLINAANSAPEGAYVSSAFARPGSQITVDKLQYVKLARDWNWMVGSGLYMDDVRSKILLNTLSAAAIGLVVLLVVSGLGVVVARSVLLGFGGEPKVAIEVMRRVAAGNLRITGEQAPEGSVLAGLSHMVESLHHTVSRVRGSIDTIETSSAEISAGSGDLSTRTERTAASLQETAASMEQISSTVQRTDQSARTARNLALLASESAVQGSEVVSSVISTMTAINHSSQKISQIIGVIDGIAFQTNILALNAAVEAARAGEQGRGFAVVAGEVRSLAQRCALAAKEIKILVDDSVGAVESGSGQVAAAETAMNEIRLRIGEVTKIVSEISQATSEQSAGVGQVKNAVDELDLMTQENAALVEESAAAADSLKQQARQLSAVVAGFQLT